MAVSAGAISLGVRAAWSLAALRGLLASCRYVAERPGRDLRLDFLRGFCVFAMVVDHIGGASWLYTITGGNTSAVSAAEGFVFLSGLVMGIVYRAKLDRDGFVAAVRGILRRAWTLYTLTVALTLMFAAVTAMTDLKLWVDRSAGLGIDNWPELVVAAVTLHYTWNGTDILALYVLLVASAPLIFFLLAEGHTRWVLAGSASLWALYQVYPERAAIPWTIQNAEMFPLAAWQLLFVFGLVFGYHRREVGRRLIAVVERPVRPTVAVKLGLAAVAATMLGIIWGLQPATAVAPGALPVVGLADLYDKPSLAIGRLALFGLVALAALAATTYAWRPLNAVFGRVLVPLGQASLYVYAMHLFLILACYNVPPYVGSDQPGLELHNTIGQLAIVAALWLMVRTQFLFKVVPR